MEIQKSQIKDESLVAKRRKQITDAALGLFLQKGYHATTIREICRESGVNRGSLYDYVSGKQDILISIYQQMMETRTDDWQEFAGNEDGAEREPLRVYIRALISRSWNRFDREILVLYRESDALDRETMKQVLALESKYITKVAGELRARSGLGEEAEDRVRVLANLLVFVNAFLPLRGWNLKHEDRGFVLDLAVDMFMRMLDE
jgi:AcrR family transcriptional regulator